MSVDRFILLRPGEARPGRIPLPPAFAVKAMTDDTLGRFSLLEVTVARDIPRHSHHTADECIYVRCASEPPPRVLQISSPGGWEHYLEDGELDPVKINPIAAKYDIHYEPRQPSKAAEAGPGQDPGKTA